jgi:hypothetical protein
VPDALKLTRKNKGIDILYLYLVELFYRPPDAGFIAVFID